uniref:Uncharacterized protein n=1 Tax=Leptobrachium leishanense TaxID=445787 RepID=A0A8C5PIH0_9ANUR
MIFRLVSSQLLRTLHCVIQIILQKQRKKALTSAKSPFHMSQVLKIFVSEKKYIVFESCLDELLTKYNKCTKSDHCDAPIISFEKVTTGCLLKVYTICEQNHKCLVWRSQPLIGKRSIGNILASAGILFSGSHYAKINEYFKLIGVPFISKSSHYMYQKYFLFPVIDVHYKKEQKKIIDNVKAKAICLTGDGQCDSPGFCAKYCTYTFIDYNTKKILDFSLIQVSEATSSVAMEKQAFTRCIDKLIADGLIIRIIATDRHVCIRKVMRERYPQINHQFDIWHYCKSMTKKLQNLAKKKSLSELAPWTTSIVNHMWSCSSFCKGDPEVLRERWRSLLRHVLNEHCWESNGEQKRCDHATIPENEDWLKRHTPAHNKLIEFVTNKRMDRELPHLTYFCHTGDLEVYHSMILKYRPTLHC